MKDSIRWKAKLENSEKTNRYREEVLALDKQVGAFLEFDPDRASGIPRNPEKGTGPLSGIPFAVKDNIAVKDFGLTCGSKILEKFVSPYTATAVKKLETAGAVVAGKTNLDEFGMGSSCDTSALGKTSNPWDLSRVTGGSSGGSAAAVASGMVPFALGTDTGGSIRQPASFCGIYGLKPTYGAVSRYGLVAYASSLEVIGVLAGDVDTTREVFNIITGVDPMDHSTLPAPERSKQTSDKAVKTIGVFEALEHVDPPVEKAYRTAIEGLKASGYDIEYINIATFTYVVPVYYTIATAEASANLARYNGIRYGLSTEWAENPEELVTRSRNEGFGEEVKLRILLGTYVLRSGFQDQYYIRAQKIRTAIRNELDQVFSKVDLIMTPVFPTLAFRHGDAGLSPFQQKVADHFTAFANLAGIPALAVPVTVEDGLPAGVQLVAPAFQEDKLFATAKQMETVFPLQHPELFMGGN